MRINYGDLLLVPEFVFEEIAHAADVTRNVLVLDNMEEKQFYAANPGKHQFIQPVGLSLLFSNKSLKIIC